MVYKKRKFRRRRFKRRASMYGGFGPKMVRRNLAPNRTFAKLRVSSGMVSSNAGGTGTSTLSHYFTVRNPSSSTDWNSFVNLYDSYKVSFIKIQYVPHVPPGNSTTYLYTAAYIVYDVDVDNANPISTVAGAINYQNCKVFNLCWPMKYTIRPGYIASTGGSNVVLGGGWIDTSSPTNIGCIGILGLNLSNSSEYGEFICTYYVQFKNRR